MRASATCLAFALLAPLAACDEPTELDRSHDTWRAENAQHDAYEYTRHFSSWTGYTMDTRVTVRGDEVIGRAFEDSDGASWYETGAEVGTHSAGHPAVTLDALYDQCAEEVLTQDPAEHEIILELDDRGFLQQCTYRAYSCEDDCLDGITIQSLEFLLEDCRGGGEEGGDC
jgi:hypothetical protein